MIAAEELLTTIAQIAITIAALAGVVVALSPRPLAQWSDLERYNFRVLLQVSAVTILFALLPLVLARSLAEAAVWRWGLLAYGVAHLLDVGSFMLARADSMSTVTRVTTGLGVSIALLQVGLASFGPAATHETMYLVALIWQLGISYMGFTLLLYARRPEA